MTQERRRGFASMDPEKRRQISSKGGSAAHRQGTAHKFDSAEAAEAGKIGGRSVSADREHMASIGRLGGLARSRGVDGKASIEDECAECARGHPPVQASSPVSLIGENEASCMPVPEVPAPRISDSWSSEGAELRRPDMGEHHDGIAATPKRLLLENGPFGGYSVAVDDAREVPARLLIDRTGRVVDPEGGVAGISAWVGRQVEPLAPAVRADDHPGIVVFGYEGTDDSEAGYNGVLKFQPHDS